MAFQVVLKGILRHVWGLWQDVFSNIAKMWCAFHWEMSLCSVTLEAGRAGKYDKSDALETPRGGFWEVMQFLPGAFEIPVLRTQLPCCEEPRPQNKAFQTMAGVRKPPRWFWPQHHLTATEWETQKEPCLNEPSYLPEMWERILKWLFSFKALKFWGVVLGLCPCLTLDFPRWKLSDKLRIVYLWLQGGRRNNLRGTSI